MFTSPRRMQAISELGFEHGFLKSAQALGLPRDLAVQAFEKISGKKVEKPEKKLKKKPKADAGPESAAKPAAKPAPKAPPAPAPQAGPPPAPPVPEAPQVPSAPPMGGAVGGGGGGGMPQLNPVEMMILQQLQQRGQLGGM